MSDQHTTVQYQLRLPEELRDKIKESASAHNRSMNADIVARLEASFEKSFKSADFKQSDYEELKQHMEFISKELDAFIKHATEHQNSEY